MPEHRNFLDDRRVITLPVERLKPCQHNARTHTKKQLQQIANSIRQFGFVNPILVNQDNQIIAGHGRVKAAKTLDMDIVPAIRLEHLSEAEQRAYVIADNRLAELAGWDEAILAIEFQYLIDLDLQFDVTVTGFETPEIDVILNGTEEEPDPDEMLPPMTPDRPPVSRPGDCWKLGKHRILCGDCRDPMAIDTLMTGRKARMVFTDPPYNVRILGHARGLGKRRHREFAIASGELSEQDYVQFLKDSLTQHVRVSKSGALHFICMDWRHIQALQSASENLYSALLNLCVWVKSNGGMGSLYRSQHELIFVYQAGKGSHANNVELGRHGRYRTNVWHYPGMNSFGRDRTADADSHPTVKPVRLVSEAILDATDHGDIVLDGYLGSGTTVLAAERTRRRCFGVELDPLYVDLAIRRWQAMTGKLAVNEATGDSFREVEEKVTEQTDGGCHGKA